MALLALLRGKMIKKNVFTYLWLEWHITQLVYSIWVYEAVTHLNVVEIRLSLNSALSPPPNFMIFLSNGQSVLFFSPPYPIRLFDVLEFDIPPSIILNFISFSSITIFFVGGGSFWGYVNLRSNILPFFHSQNCKCCI